MLLARGYQKNRDARQGVSEQLLSSQSEGRKALIAFWVSGSGSSGWSRADPRDCPLSPATSVWARQCEGPAPVEWVECDPMIRGYQDFDNFQHFDKHDDKHDNKHDNNFDDNFDNNQDYQDYQDTQETIATSFAFLQTFFSSHH
ncbi:hypothetical protein PGQ11_015198 [Apiospora arundinis]|uniref:Uncharacterized protein n=1 Tax=Apiospora arundinis TaxID=335852 RepID=A0ABR2HL63_9PEZI